MTKKKRKPSYGLHKRYTRKAGREFLDQDYLEELKKKDPAAAEWMDKFNREYYQAHFAGDETDLHQTPEQKRDIYNKNNQRNRDMWSKFVRVPGDVQAAPPKDDDDE